MEHTYLLPSVARNVARYLQDNIFAVDLSDPEQLRNTVLDLSFPSRIGNQNRKYLFYGWPLINQDSSDGYGLKLVLERALTHKIIILDSPGSTFSVNDKNLIKTSIGGIELVSPEIKESIKQDVLNLVKIYFQYSQTINEGIFLRIIKQIIEGIVSKKEVITSITSLREKVERLIPNEDGVYKSLLLFFIQGFILGPNYSIPPIMEEIFG
jgi:hypothetical protein